MKILLAEDDRRLARLIMRMLENEGYRVVLCEDGETAFERVLEESFDILILDWMLPKKEGVIVSRELRKKGYQGAILMLTARDQVDDLVQGFDSGVDDYLSKPFEFKELFARVAALGRRRSFLYEDNWVMIGDLRLDIQNHVLNRGEEEIQLTPKEFQLLVLFARHKNQVLTRDSILQHVWGADSDVTMNTLEAFVKLLRKKLDPSGGKKYIQTVRGIGYRMEKE
ncbi:response regulator transcription factor [Fictibacillus sp. KIGAM418]|uniref:Response regulator transcription factor n=1 Tax=Fictibacillus marinisediminis TaxID=2878389 RepID=A0A9X1XEQ8_9BACL|nr:response regulator transcription factor [Fictibacillus marinisediminis]MCK6259326.1 response regulator transcription factor [Fictibacillus marinisediminis]